MYTANPPLLDEVQLVRHFYHAVPAPGKSTPPLTARFHTSSRHTRLDHGSSRSQGSPAQRCRSLPRFLSHETSPRPSHASPGPAGPPGSGGQRCGHRTDETALKASARLNLLGRKATAHSDDTQSPTASR
eukprot:765990-Hanusia_phi.AAC.7